MGLWQELRDVATFNGTWLIIGFCVPFYVLAAVWNMAYLAPFGSIAVSALIAHHLGRVRQMEYSDEWQVYVETHRLVEGTDPKW